MYHLKFYFNHCLAIWNSYTDRSHFAPQYDLNHSLLWRHNGPDGVSNHQPHDCLLSHIFRCRKKNTSKLRVTGLYAGNSPGTGEFPAQRASNAENVSIWWRHHGNQDIFAEILASIVFSNRQSILSWPNGKSALIRWWPVVQWMPVNKWITDGEVFCVIWHH